MTTKDFCNTCGGHHESDPSDCYLDYNGFRFIPPFRCMCCGKEICARQFAFGRCCGVCDIGGCNSLNQSFKVKHVHEHPEWWSGNPALFWSKYIVAVGATYLEG